MMGLFLFNKIKVQLVLCLLLVGAGTALAEGNVQSVSVDNLPINVANSPTANSAPNVQANALVSPSKPATVATTTDAVVPANSGVGAKTAPVSNQQLNANNFNFDLKMKAIDTSKQVAPQPEKQIKNGVDPADLPQNIQYKASPIDNLGNSILSQVDSDFFTQLSNIEKATSILQLELRREELRNKIEAQKAMREKNKNDLDREKAETEMKNLEKKKQLEVAVIKEQEQLLDKQQLFEVIKQRKLLNAYMNQMLLAEQKWVKEKESLYAQLAAAEAEKKEIISSFKQRVDNILDVSIKNIQRAEAAKTNFDRIIKMLKARNEQLKRRVEADAKIIKEAQTNVQFKSSTIDELKNRSQLLQSTEPQRNTQINIEEDADDENTAERYKRISSEYAILGITGRSDNMNAEIIDSKGQPMSLKVGSLLPTGHRVSEIGSDYIKFNSDNGDDYLYVGKSIDGVVPSIGVLNDKVK